MSYKLHEGMWAGDLTDIVQPLVSIDEFESKIDDNAIVIGFYVSDEDAATDLNRFIQRSPVNIIDSDQSPSPDMDGYFMVFVEILYDERVANNIKKILDEVNPLVGVSTWQVKIRNYQKKFNFDEDKIKKCLYTNHIKDKISSLEKKVNTIKHKIRATAKTKDRRP